MRTPEDLTGKDGDIIFLEYCEEYPPLLSQASLFSDIFVMCLAHVMNS